jgi:hypothetical protein
MYEQGVKIKNAREMQEMLNMLQLKREYTTLHQHRENIINTYTPRLHGGANLLISFHWTLVYRVTNMQDFTQKQVTFLRQLNQS